MIESQDNNFELQAWGIRLILLQGQRARQEFPGDYFYLSNEISNIWASCKRYSLDVFMEWKEEADSLVKVGAGRDQEVGNAKKKIYVLSVNLWCHRTKWNCMFQLRLCSLLIFKRKKNALIPFFKNFIRYI